MKKSIPTHWLAVLAIASMVIFTACNQTFEQQLGSLAIPTYTVTMPTNYIPGTWRTISTQGVYSGSYMLKGSKTKYPITFVPFDYGNARYPTQAGLCLVNNVSYYTNATSTGPCRMGANTNSNSVYWYSANWVDGSVEGNINQVIKNGVLVATVFKGPITVGGKTGTFTTTYQTPDKYTIVWIPK